MTVELNWQEGVPSEKGPHFVAVKLGEATGIYDFLNWNGEVWENLDYGSVIAFVSLQHLKNSLDIKWPEDSEVAYKSRELPSEDSDLWSEG